MVVEQPVWPTKIKNFGLHWALEVEWSHRERFENILLCNEIRYSCLEICNGKNAIIFTSLNIATSEVLSPEFLKFISRIFYVPHSCRDPEWILYDVELRHLVDENAIFKLQTSPRSLANSLIDMLLPENDDRIRMCSNINSRIKIKPSSNSHLLQCIYSPTHSLFYWGIVSEEFANENFMNNKIFYEKVINNHIKIGMTPISRAFYKLQELFDYYFLNWNWIIKSNQCSIDIGASPGGWCQVLSKFSNKIIAIDPGLLHPSVATLPQIIHIPKSLDCEEVQNILREMSIMYSINLCVCDVNFDAVMAAQALRTYILPYVNGYRSSSNIEHVTSSSSCHQASSYVIFTLKFPKHPKEKHIRKTFSSVKAIFEDAGCWDIRMVHLNANSSNERTVACRMGTLYS